MALKKEFFLILLALPLCAWAAPNLDLSQLEKVAVHRAPELKQLQANKEALGQDAIADDQWNDPKLTLGTSNVPTDSYSFTQENMTQIQVGLMQQLPKGDSLGIRSLQDRLQASATASQKTLMKLTILRSVRINWLNACYWEKAISVYLKERRVFKHLLSVNSKRLQNNQIQQKDVVRAQFELSQLEQKILSAKQGLSEAKAALNRWVPLQMTNIKFQLPHWPNPPTLKVLKDKIKRQPLLMVDNKHAEAKEQGIQLAEQQYIPGVSVGIVYGIRQGKDMAGNERSNFIGAQVSMSLPLFTDNRQDKRVKASQERYTAALMKEASDYRELKSQLLDNYAAWRRLREQYHIYKQKLQPESQHYVEATLVAYQNKQTDFPTLARAYITDYNTQLATLKTQVGMLQAQANLFYLQGR